MHELHQCLQVRSAYEQARLDQMEENAKFLELLQVCKIGKTVHIPYEAFKDDGYQPPTGGYWVGKLVNTRQGGTGDVGISVEGEPLFTRSLKEVAKWVVD